jgi:ribosomal protein S19
VAGEEEAVETVEADEADEAVEAVEVEAVVAAAVEAVEAVDRRSQGCWRLTSVRHLIILPRFCVTHLISYHDGRNFFAFTAFIYTSYIL